MRFFYNLGLECFRGSNNWNYLTNEQSTDFEQWYQGTLTSKFMKTLYNFECICCKDIPQSEDEVTNISNGVMQHCTLTQGKQENNNDQNENSSQSFSQESGDKCVNRTKDMHIQRTEPPKTDNRKDVPYSPREKVKDQESVNRDSSRLNRNSLGPRFKKNSDGTYQELLADSVNITFRSNYNLTNILFTLQVDIVPLRNLRNQVTSIHIVVQI